MGGRAARGDSKIRCDLQKILRRKILPGQNGSWLVIYIRNHTPLWTNSWSEIWLNVFCPCCKATYVGFSSRKAVRLQTNVIWLYINYQLDALIIIYSQNIIFLYTFRASSAHLQEDTVVYMQHMVLSLSMRVPGGLSVNSSHSSCVPTGNQELS